MSLFGGQCPHAHVIGPTAPLLRLLGFPSAGVSTQSRECPGVARQATVVRRMFRAGGLARCLHSCLRELGQHAVWEVLGTGTAVLST